MKTIAIYRVPVRTYTAVELAAMPLSEMQARLEAQEKHAASFNTIGHDAFELLQLVQGGALLMADHDKAGRHHWRVNGKHIKPAPVGQLYRRGFLELKEVA